MPLEYYKIGNVYYFMNQPEIYRVKSYEGPDRSHINFESEQRRYTFSRKFCDDFFRQPTDEEMFQLGLES